MRKTILAALLAAPMLASAANLVQNGSFESNAQGAGTWNIYSTLTGWTSDAYGIELRNNVAGKAYDGVNFVELDTTRNSAMYQDVATTAGASYTLSFAYSARPATAQRGLTTNDIDVFWNGIKVADIGGVNLSTTDHDWKIYSFNVIGSAGPGTRLEFKAAGTSDSFGGSIDAVAITPVPEPETYALMLAGLGLVGFVARRRKVV